MKNLSKKETKIDQNGHFAKKRHCCDNQNQRIRWKFRGSNSDFLYWQIAAKIKHSEILKFVKSCKIGSQKLQKMKYGF